MPDTNMVDEVVNARFATRGPGARATHEESVSASDGAVKAGENGVENESHSPADRRGRVFKDSTKQLMEKLEKEHQDAEKPAHDEGDADEDEPDEDGDGEPDGDAGDDAGADEGDAGEAGDDDGDAEGDSAPEVDNVAARLEARNRELVSELETARKTPKAQRTEREAALISAEASYYDEGSIPALRKFLSIVVGAAPDSKEVDAELSGVLTDLTARELGVSLDHNQQALRDNARTRLLLARDRREKADADKKPSPDNSAEDVNYETAANHIDNLLSTKGQSGTSPADEYPMLMSLAEDFDGFKPSAVLARAIRREIMTGTLDPTKLSDADMVRAVAPKIEKHYENVAKKIEAARLKKNTKKPDTTTPSGKPKVAVEARTEQRRSAGAPTITTATASRAPSTPPKVGKQKAQTATEKTRKDFGNDAAWRKHLLEKHFKS